MSSSTRSAMQFTTNVAGNAALPSVGQPQAGVSAQHKQVQDLHALVIGINLYTNAKTSGFGDLTYCVGDANNMAEFLEVKLGVPSKNITNLRDNHPDNLARYKPATRENIITAIKALGSNEDIKEGSPIFIFYAGHGGTSKHIHTNLQYEVLCPSDVTTSQDPRPDDPRNKTVSGIPDYEIQKLINEVASKKGNNIAVFLDCCHSAGMNRKDSDATERKIEIDITPLSDNDYPVEKGNRGVIPALARRNHQSHVLLAACGKDESARECPHVGHGWMTNALLKLFNTAPIESMTYDTLLSNLEVTCQICTKYDAPGFRRQMPHCDGFNLERQLFATTSLKSLIRGRQVGSIWTIPCGTLAGVLPQARFNIYATEDATKQLGILAATEVTAGSSQLVFLPDQEQFWIPPQFFALQLSRFQNFSVFCSEVEKLDATFPDREYFGIILSADNDSADASVEFEGESNSIIYRGQKYASENDILGNILRNTSINELPGTLHDAAAFYHHLGRVGPTKFDQVTVKLLHLVVEGDSVKDIDSSRTIELADHPAKGQSGSPFTKTATVIADVPMERTTWTRPIGLEIINSSDEDLYPYVFVFTPRSLRIERWHTVAHAEKPDIALKRKSTCSIGFNGEDLPWGFNLNPEAGLKKDVAYIKIFLTTRPTPELEHIVQDPWPESSQEEQEDGPDGALGAAADSRPVASGGRGFFPGLKPKVVPIMPVLCQWGVQVIEVVQQLADGGVAS